MYELKRLIEAYKQIDFSNRKAALATVVKLYGSSYRRPGARMLVTDDGHWTGAISGGCLEGDALRKARKVMNEGKPALVTYDTMSDGSTEMGIALGCNGIIDVLIEPLNPNNTENPIHILEKAISDDRLSVIGTVYKSDEEDVFPGERLMIDYTGKEISTIKGKNLYNLLTSDIHKVVEDGKSVSKIYEIIQGKTEVFFEAILPGIRLVIFGGGYDAVPMCQQGASLGWDVTVTDNCIAHLAPKRFPAAKEIVAAEFDQFLDKISINQYTAIILMSHDYYKDLAVLKQVLKSEANYIGILGPKKRGEKMKEDLSAEGITLSEFDIKRIHNPMGLDIGAETPEEIALSTLAEIQAHFSNRKGSQLKEKDGYIHERTERGLDPKLSGKLKPTSCSLPKKG
ncbi:XdhC/CoxI family protein [Flammeovirgaceae bacterium SG7u.111]|nr:XdhC/CoxI family protein [Flammeovirgaceae bacterium SG7u.132]WPO38554.1 XdhC/CoxI family protein [Flammeovirgaceae bacterium SG7u.111]